MFQQDGGVRLPAPLSESHHEPVLGVGWTVVVPGVKTHKIPHCTHSTYRRLIPFSVATSPFTDFVSITVNTLSAGSSSGLF